MNVTKRFCNTSVLPLLTAVIVCLFFGLYYPHHLHFQEQFQLFLFDADYAREVMSVPGGVADYLGRFITQFFLYAWIGALWLGILIAAIHAVAVRPLGRGWLSVLSFLPAILLTRAMCDENCLTGSLVAILLAQLTAWCYTLLKPTAYRPVAALILFPFLYWAAGPIAFLFVVLITIHEIQQQHLSLTVISALIALFIVSLALPQFLSRYVAVEPQYMYSGIHYFRVHDADMNALWWSLLVIAMFAALSSFSQKKWSTTNRPLMPLLVSLAVAVIGCFTLVKPAYNSNAEEGMAYDFMARHQQWNKIQLNAGVNPPRNAISMTALNLALAQSGRLTDQMFHFQQHGNLGLIPVFERDAVSPLTTAEVFYHLGMINSAQRFIFEAQEAILDYQKSSRCYKRLAETNLIRGNYKVADKYLSALKKTLFYRQWAEETSALLGDEAAINSHHEYGPLRQNLCQEDFFYNGRNLPMMLHQLFYSNRQNRLAFEYLEAECLLTKDLDSFVQYFSQNTEINYATLPTHFQEALLLFWSMQHPDLSQIPPGIAPGVVDKLKRFGNDAQQFSGNPEILRKQYGMTYWYYFLTH